MKRVREGNENHGRLYNYTKATTTVSMKSSNDINHRNKEDDDNQPKKESGSPSTLDSRFNQTLKNVQGYVNGFSHFPYLISLKFLFFSSDLITQLRNIDRSPNCSYGFDIWIHFGDNVRSLKLGLVIQNLSYFVEFRFDLSKIMMLLGNLMWFWLILLKICEWKICVIIKSLTNSLLPEEI